eukprot:1843138-Lingulodinium_polyedra.AAC.1
MEPVSTALPGMCLVIIPDGVVARAAGAVVPCAAPGCATRGVFPDSKCLVELRRARYPEDEAPGDAPQRSIGPHAGRAQIAVSLQQPGD